MWRSSGRDNQNSSSVYVPLWSVSASRIAAKAATSTGLTNTRSSTPLPAARWSVKSACSPSTSIWVWSGTVKDGDVARPVESLYTFKWPFLVRQSVRPVTGRFALSEAATWSSLSSLATRASWPGHGVVRPFSADQIRLDVGGPREFLRTPFIGGPSGYLRADRFGIELVAGGHAPGVRQPVKLAAPVDTCGQIGGQGDEHAGPPRPAYARPRPFAGDEIPVRFMPVGGQGEIPGDALPDEPPGMSGRCARRRLISAVSSGRTAIAAAVAGVLASASSSGVFVVPDAVVRPLVGVVVPTAGVGLGFGLPLRAGGTAIRPVAMPLVAGGTAIRPVAGRRGGVGVAQPRLLRGTSPSG